MAISTEGRDFFIARGERIALLRKAHGITQAQLAEVLGVSQQTVQACEVGRRRIQVAALPVVARMLKVSLEELFGESKQAARGKRRPSSKLEHHLERIGSLPKPRQHAVIDVIEAMLAQQGHEARRRRQPWN